MTHTEGGSSGEPGPDAGRVDVVTVTPNPALDWTLTVPGFVTGAVNRADALGMRAGGKGVNVAAALAAWGCHAHATGFLGRANADSFEALFADSGIADRFVRIDGETRVSIKLVDTGRGETTDINLPGAPPSDMEVTALLDLLDTLAPACFVLAGSLPPGVPDTFYAAITSRLREGGSRIVVDASGPALRAAIEARPHVVKPNVHELEALVGVRLSTVDAIVDAARALVEEGVELAVVSMGAEGALFVDAEREVLALPIAVDVGSTVGAGDAMVAGIVAGLFDGHAVDGIARRATAFAAVALGHGLGATTRTAIAAMEARVELREL